jgi:hypothetical protein
MFIDGLQSESKVKISAQPVRITNLDRAIELATVYERAVGVSTNANHDVNVNFAKQQQNSGNSKKSKPYQKDKSKNSTKKVDGKIKQKQTLSVFIAKEPAT